MSSRKLHALFILVHTREPQVHAHKLLEVTEQLGPVNRPWIKVLLLLLLLVTMMVSLLAVRSTVQLQLKVMSKAEDAQAST